jgi:hypothetical protein
MIYKEKTILMKVRFIDMLLNNLEGVMESYNLYKERQPGEHDKLEKEYSMLMTRRKFWTDKLKG